MGKHRAGRSGEGERSRTDPPLCVHAAGKRQRFNAATRDRARSAYSSLTPRDVVIRHQWLFAAHWLQESVDEIEDDRLDYNKREERVRNARVDALREIWTEKGFDGIRVLTAASGASGTIG